MSWLASLLTSVVTGTVTALKLLSGAKSAPLATKPPLSDDELGWKPRQTIIPSSAALDEEPTSPDDVRKVN